MKIAAIGDLHTQHTSTGFFRELFSQISQKADVLLLCGDLTDNGFAQEAQILAEELRFCRIPVLGVLGNHDCASNQQNEIKQVLAAASMVILDEEPHELNGVGFAGVKGFCGGFDNYMLTILGEEVVKLFVYETINEVLKLENALQKLQTDKKVVVLHYSPIRQTVEGEPPELFPFLGSSRLSEPLDSFNVSVCFHGHAHLGIPEGKTSKGVRVVNASMSLRIRLNHNQPYALTEI